MSDDNIFPFGFDEEELREELARRAKALRPRDIESAQIDVPFVQLGIVDLQSRITSKLTGLVEAQSRTSVKVARRSLIISGLSLLIVIVALYISISSNISNSRWEQNQLNVLNQILTAQKDTNKSLADLNKLMVEHRPFKDLDRLDDLKKTRKKTR